MSTTGEIKSGYTEVFYIDRRSNGLVHLEVAEGGVTMQFCKNGTMYWTDPWEKGYSDQVEMSDVQFRLDRIIVDDFKRMVELITPSTMCFMLEALTAVGGALGVDEYTHVDMSTILHICMRLSNIERISNAAFMATVLRAEFMKAVTMKVSKH